MWDLIIEKLGLIKVVDGMDIYDGDTIFQSYAQDPNGGNFCKTFHSFTWDEPSEEPGVKYYVMRKPFDFVTPNKYPEGTIVLGRSVPSNKPSPFIRSTGPRSGVFTWKPLDHNNYHPVSIIVDKVLYNPEEEDNA